MVVPVSAAAQTTQWSSPVTTERWSEAPATPPAKDEPRSAREGEKQGERPRWSDAPYTPQVDPADMDNPAVVERPAPLPAGIAGDWRLHVPGGVWYSQEGDRIMRNHSAGASLNRLIIRGDGSYDWAGRRGRLMEIRPWFAQPGERYFAVRMNADNQYMARYDSDQDRLNLFFWGVGGHAARGDRH
jgi:hypothetical protein